MSVCCVESYLWVSLSPLSLFVRTPRAHVVLVDSQESRRRVIEELTQTLLSSGWVCRGSNSLMMLTPFNNSKMLIKQV